MSLASIEGNIGILLIAAVVALLNWLTKRNEASSQTPSNEEDAAESSSSEEERTRRFFEALGIPPDQAPKRPAQRSQRRGQEPTQPLPNIQPRGSVVAGGLLDPMRRERDQRKRAVPPPVHGGPGDPFHQRPDFERKVSSPPLRQIPGVVPVSVPPVLPIPPVRAVLEVEVPVANVYGADVLAIPFEASHADMRDAYKTSAEREIEQPAVGFASLLKSRVDLRRAFILKEILDTPRGLQSDQGLPNFR